MRKLSADLIYPIVSEPLPEGVLVVDDEGVILSVEQRGAFDDHELEYFPGVLVPGFVNVHCHMELSHMFGKVDTGTGLIPFITSVVRQREVEMDIILDAVRSAEDEMIGNGIVAVGDISNTSNSFRQKESGRMHYHTFVEMFDFLQDGNAQSCFDQYMGVYDQVPENTWNKKTCVPHSPYTVSRTLFTKINNQNNGSGHTVSLHNQEMEPERQLFVNKSGELIDFYKSFGVELDSFVATGQDSIYYAIEHMDPEQRTLFVHNTLTSEEDIAAAHGWCADMFWATCPNANLYIENKLPDYRAFINQKAQMTIGTDSLTSNWQLSILEEMKTIQRYQSYVHFDELIVWATLNGARALGFEDVLGSFEAGKTPGVNHLSYNPLEGQLSRDVAGEQDSVVKYNGPGRKYRKRTIS